MRFLSRMPYIPQSMSELQIDKSLADGILTVRLSGEVGLSEEYRFRQQVNDVLKDHPPKLIVDLQQVTLLSSYGIAAVVNLWKQQHAAGGRICVVVPQNHIFDCLSIAGTNKIIPVFHTESEALAFYAKQ